MHLNIDEVIPLADITITVHDSQIQHASNLAGQKLPVQGDTVTLHRLELYDVVVITTVE
jgi:hypothetical protein